MQLRNFVLLVLSLALLGSLIQCRSGLQEVPSTSIEQDIEDVNIKYINGSSFLVGKKKGLIRIGKWKEYNSDGILVVERFYDENGRSIEAKSFYQSGKLSRWYKENSSGSETFDYDKLGLKKYSLTTEDLDGNIDYYTKSIERVFQEGKLISESSYFDNGDEYTTKSYHNNGSLQKYYKEDADEEYIFIQMYDSLGTKILDYKR